MPTPLVFKISALALLGLSLGPLASAQDGAPREDAPRPRVNAPRAFGAAPGMAMLVEGERPKLGVMVTTSAEGVVVEEVQPDSTAAAAGVKAGDLLLSLDGERLVEPGDIGRLLADVEPGSSFSLSVVRAGEGIVKLEGKRPEQKPRERLNADGHQGAFLGVVLGEASDAGVTIESVQPNTAAWFAALEAGDVLKKVGDAEVGSAEDVAGAVASHAPGSVVALAWTRDGESHSTKVRLGHRGPAVSMFGPGGGAFVLPRGHSQGGSFSLRGPGNRFFLGGEDGAFELHLEDLEDQLEALQDLDLHMDLDELKQLPHTMRRFQLHGKGGPHDLREMLEKHGVDWDELHDGAHDLKIKIENGRVEIDRDGEIETFELKGDDQDATGAALFVNPQNGGGLYLAAPRGAAGGRWSLTTNRAFPFAIAGDADCEMECDVACEVDADCEQVKAECEAIDAACDGAKAKAKECDAPDADATAAPVSDHDML